jgi:hypothetical protein
VDHVRPNLERDGDLFSAMLGASVNAASSPAADGSADQCPVHKNGLWWLPDRVCWSRAARDGRFHHLDGRGAGRPEGGVGYYVEGGAFYDAPNTPDEAKLTSGLKFAKKTATVMSYEQYFRREEVCGACTTPLQKPFVYLCIPSSRYVQYTSGILGSQA